ncbi:MAG: undecaprenyldiphospho-muramoylpentapeptide beta-N-acetylglucosaminyltransferase [Fibrobacterota bacterium]
MKLLIAAGGTGGHIYPALAVMQELQRRGVDVLWITTERGDTERIARDHGISRMVLDVEGLQRKLSLQPLLALWKMARAMVQMLRHVNHYDGALAFGGYVCGPLLQACRFKKIPFYLQEQNSVPGLVNRVFGKHARAVFTGMDLKNPNALAPAKIIHTGTPVRARRKDYSDAVLPHYFSRGEQTILICGGSQGAYSMNKVLYQAVDYIAALGVQIIWQTGEMGFSEVKTRYAEMRNVYAAPTFTDMYPLYSMSMMLIGRAGASTISEAALFGLPSVLIPLPWSAEDHQRFNAANAQQQGWARMIEQGAHTSQNLIEIYRSVFDGQTDRFNRMRDAALKHSPVNAAGIVAEKVVHGVK